MFVIFVENLYANKQLILIVRKIKHIKIFLNMMVFVKKLLILLNLVLIDIILVHLRIHY